MVTGIPKIKRIECRKCNKHFERKGNRQVYCSDCQNELLKEWYKKRHKTRKRQIWVKNYQDIYRARKKIIDKKWYENNKEKFKQYQKKYRKLNLEKNNMRGYAYRYMRDLILERDEYKCTNCDSKENLDIHHLKYTQKNKKMERINNLKIVVTLCRKCHINHHKGNIPIIKRLM